MNIKKVFFVAVVLNYLVPSWQWNDGYIYKFLATYFPAFQSQDTVWFLSERLTTQHTEALDGFIKRTNDMAKITQYVFTNRSDLRMTNMDSKRNSMAMVFTTGSTDPIMHVHNRMLTRRHIGLSIVIYVDKVLDLRRIEEICHALYKGSFYNSIVFFETVGGINQIFGYRQFPSFRTENRTDFQTYIRAQYARAMSASQDVQGYRFYTPLRQDMPHVIRYRDSQGEDQIHGTTYRILKEFVDSLNGTMVEHIMPPDKFGGEAVNMKAMLELVRSRQLDVVAHAYALYDADDDLDKSYPIMVVKWCLMVPVRNSISTFLYPLQPFDWKVWLCVLVSFVSLCVVDLFRLLLQTKVFGQRHKFFALLSNVWLDDFCHIIYLATASPIQTTSWIRLLIYLEIFFFGFFLSANYTSFLGSFLTVTLFRAQINSMDDIIKAQLPVMVVDYELEFLYSQGYELPRNFSQLLRPVDTATFTQHQQKFNTSYAYFTTEDTWHFLNEAQKHLKQAVFKYSDICFGSYHLAYPIQTDSAVWRDLEYFTFRIHSNGLLQTYEQDAFQYALSSKHLQRLMETHDYTSAGLEHLVLIFIILGAMCGLSGICLLIELLLYKCRGNRSRI
uniref:Ionotropic glutamate receptor C-terminal domain-containing protein n=1 Tax=Stomoxys calcitrans TaxID=35570 RepID=A0A1I8PMH7_STOCA